MRLTLLFGISYNSGGNYHYAKVQHTTMNIFISLGEHIAIQRVCKDELFAVM